MTKKLQIIFSLALALLLQITLSAQVVINEINYHSADDFDTKDWIELHNTNPGQVDLSNWSFKDDNDDNNFIFPEGTNIEGNGYLVVVRNIDSFTVFWPEVLNYVGEFDFGLNNGGELLRLFNGSGTLVDTVHYDDESPWPTEPDGNGQTLQLTDPSLDNADASNWFSPNNNGTPGAPNTPLSIYDNYTKIELSVSPNPMSSSGRLNINTITGSGEGNILIFNAFGQKIQQISYNGEQSIDLNTSEMASGIYSLRLIDRENRTTGVVKFVVIQ